MAGSLKWMVYESDSGASFPVFIDESNGESCGFTDLTADASANATLPKTIKMRYVNAVSTTTGARRRFYMGTVAAYVAALGATGGVTTPDDTFSVSSGVGEKRRKPIAADTGLLDGDDS